MSRRRKILVADLLCGAGGSSTGCGRALAELGLDMDLVCVNHWPVAIDTHKRNHPEARHYVQDIATVRPHLIVPEGYLDLLMASPTCTHHSVARGGKPTSDQQRSDPWHIITWFTELRVRRAIIENVWEFTSWGPVDARTGRPIKSRKGEYFRAWIDTIWKLGATLIEWRKLNAADYGEATTRSRFIAMIRFDGRSISYPAPTHRRREDGRLELFPELKPWRPAREIIDWSIRGRSIFSRKKPLAPKTLARIYAGAVKFNWSEPFLVILRNHMDGRSVDGPLPAIAANGTHIALAEPIIVNGRRNNKAKPVSANPIPALDSKGGVWLAEPFVFAPGSTGAPRAAGADPLPTITTGGAGSEDPGCARPMLVEPFIVHAAHGNDADESDPHSRRVKPIDDPLGAIHAGGGNFAIAEPFVMSRQGGGAPRAAAEPCLISPYYGSGSGETCKSAEDPLDTMTSKARFGMVLPIIHSDGSNRARDVEIDPLPVVTTVHRGELAFITAQHGEREGQAPRVHSVDNPVPTIAASGHVDLIEATAQYDILFRMLEPHELAAAMGFDSDGGTYEFAGTKTEQIKQIGNAVSVRMMMACVLALMADAAPQRAQKRGDNPERAEAAS